MRSATGSKFFNGKEYVNKSDANARKLQTDQPRWMEWIQLVKKYDQNGTFLSFPLVIIHHWNEFAICMAAKSAEKVSIRTLSSCWWQAFSRFIIKKKCLYSKNHDPYSTKYLHTNGLDWIGEPAQPPNGRDGPVWNRPKEIPPMMPFDLCHPPPALAFMVGQRSDPNRT